MKQIFSKKILYLSIIISQLIYIISQESNNDPEMLFNKKDCKPDNDRCLKITINKEGEISKECVYDVKNAGLNTINSLVVKDEIIIYDCVSDKKESECIYSLNSIGGNNTYDLSNEPSPNTCIRKKTINSNNDCCYFRETINQTKLNTSSKINYGCIEMNKFEIDKFKFMINEEKISEFIKNNNISRGMIECYSRIYKINISIIFIIFFFLFF